MRGELPKYRTVHVAGPEPKVVVLGPHGAALTATFEETMTDTAGTQTVVHGAWTAIYERAGDGWKIIQAHQSIVPEPQH